MENSYYVYTINALSLINSIKNKSKNRLNSFIVDLTDIIPAYVTMELRDDNALFYQIRQCSSGTGEIEYDINTLKDKIIIVDFKSAFEQMHYEDYDIADALLNGDSSPLSWGSLISRMLDTNEGISVIFPDHPDDPVTFLPFDKSASMAKASRISYIAKDIWNDLDERMRLGIDFSTIKVSLSKYYAYRGLYLTSGTRIDQTDKFQLNEDTVIVLPDCKVKPTDDYENDPIVYTQKNGNKSGTNYYEFEVRNEIVESNAFDGEGLISPIYASHIQKQLNNEATSFQVRMPFIKGMLHQVSFHGIISNECSIDITEDLKIRDYLGKERNLKDAQIIINESMFKCHTWLKDYWENNSERFKNEYSDDPMKFFFFQMNHYNHSMYISGSNASFYPTGKERLNYQFLSTLKLSGEDISELADRHFENAKEELKKYLQPQNAKSKTVKPFIAAAMKNPAFYKEERLIADARQQVKNIRYDCGMGSLITNGEHRYLSADLLLYIWHILRQVIIQEDSKQDMDNIINELRRKCLSEKFYMPGSAIDGFNNEENNDKAYSLFRSPHLSRNEEFLMRAYCPSDNTDLYAKYFCNLTGIVMTPVTSLVCECLGGADKDGDIVKIISDEIITNAVEKGGYINNKRILPIVNIPTSKAEEKTPTDPTEFKLLIVNTFSSYTGQISNMAITFAYDEYCDSNTNTDPENSLCANATAIVGLTIDAGKNGGHPLRNIKELKRKAKEKDYKGQNYIDFKDTMKRLRGYNYTKIKLNNDNPDEEYYYLERSSWSKEFKIYKPHDNDHVLQYLPYLYAKKDCESNDIKYLEENKLLPECQPSTSQFAFEKENYTENLTETSIKETKKLIKEYLNLNKDLRRFRIYASRGMNSYGKLITLLRIKYDSLDEILCSCPKDEGNVQISITDALDDAIYYFRSYLDQEDKANAALNALNKTDSLWLFCPKDDRISYICNIIGCNDPADIPDQVKALVTDFSFDGFYILYYIFELIYSSLIDDRSEQEKLEYWLEKNRDQEEGQYYERLLKKYKETYYISKSADQYSSENGETSNDEDSEQIEYIGWRQAVNKEAYDILLEISKDNNKNKEKPDKLIALEYAFYARKEADPRGTFFWDVLDRDLILDNINEVNRNA